MKNRTPEQIIGKVAFTQLIFEGYQVFDQSALTGAVGAPGMDGWHEGSPPPPFDSEWFIAVTTYGDRVVLTSLPKDFSYDFKTADDTYIMRGKIKKWMQFPDSEYIPYTTRLTFLTWEEYAWNEDKSVMMWVGKGQNHYYQIGMGDGKYSLELYYDAVPKLLLRSWEKHGPYPTLEAAKAAAQQDYETRIRSALTPMEPVGYAGTLADMVGVASQPSVGAKDRVDNFIDFILSDETPVTDKDQTNVEMFDKAIEAGKARLTSTPIAYVSDAALASLKNNTPAQIAASKHKTELHPNPLYASQPSLGGRIQISDAMVKAAEKEYSSHIIGNSDAMRAAIVAALLQGGSQS